MAVPASPLKLNLDINTSGEVKLHQRVHGLRCWIDDIEKPLMRPHLELLATFLVYMWRAIDGEFFNPSRQRDGTANARSRPLGRRYDLAGRRIEHAMIEGFEPNSDILTAHVSSFLSSAFRGTIQPL